MKNSKFKKWLKKELNIKNGFLIQNIKTKNPHLIYYDCLLLEDIKGFRLEVDTNELKADLTILGSLIELQYDNIDLKKGEEPTVEDVIDYIESCKVK